MNARIPCRSVEADFITRGPLMLGNKAPVVRHRRPTKLNCTVIRLVVSSTLTAGWERIRRSGRPSGRAKEAREEGGD